MGKSANLLVPPEGSARGGGGGCNAKSMGKAPYGGIHPNVIPELLASLSEAGTGILPTALDGLRACGISLIEDEMLHELGKRCEGGGVREVDVVILVFL